MNAQILAQLLTVFDLAPRDALEGAVGKPRALLCCIQAKHLIFTLLSFGILHQKQCQDWTEAAHAELHLEETGLALLAGRKENPV